MIIYLSDKLLVQTTNVFINFLNQEEYHKNTTERAPLFFWDFLHVNIMYFSICIAQGIFA